MRAVKRTIWLLSISLAAFTIPAYRASAQPYWLYWFAEAFGYGVHGGTRTLDFIVFFALFTSLVYLGAKNLFGGGEGKTSRAVIVLSVSLGMALTMGLLANTKFSLAIFYPFAKNLIFFLFVFLLYMFLIKYGGMENNKFWAFISAFIISFLIFNVASCFINEYTGGGKCDGNSIMNSLGKPFKTAGDWFSKTVNSAKDKVSGTAENAKKNLDNLKDIISPDEEKKLKQLGCHELVQQAKNPDLLCKLKEKGMDIYNVCVGGTENPYSEITRWRIAFEKCEEEYNSADAKGKAELQKDYDTSRTRYEYLLALKSLEERRYDEAVKGFDKVIQDGGSSAWLKNQARNKKDKARKLKLEKESADKIKSVEENIKAAESLKSSVKNANSPDQAYELYKKAVDNLISARKTAHELAREVGP